MRENTTKDEGEYNQKSGVVFGVGRRGFREVVLLLPTACYLRTPVATRHVIGPKPGAFLATHLGSSS
jgi:hypothetical protein